MSAIAEQLGLGTSFPFFKYKKYISAENFIFTEEELVRSAISPVLFLYLLNQKCFLGITSTAQIAQLELYFFKIASRTVMVLTYQLHCTIAPLINSAYGMTV